MELTVCKLVLAIYLKVLLVLTWPQKNEALNCPYHHVQLHICKQASFPRVSAQAMERIPWLAAEKHRAEALSAAQPLQGLAAHHRVKVHSHEVSQLGSQWGLLLFTLGEDGGMQGRRESLPHVLPTARHPAAALFPVIYAAAGWGLVSGDVSCRSRWDSQAKTPDPGQNRKRNPSSSQGGEGTDKEVLCELNSPL